MTIKAEHLRDATGVIGVALISVGSGLIYLPAGLIVAGLLLLGGAMLSARQAA